MNVRRRAPRSGRRATYLGAVSLVALCAALLAIPAGASASTVNCGGKLALVNNSDAGPRGVRYSVKCTEDIIAFSIHTSNGSTTSPPIPSS